MEHRYQEPTDYNEATYEITQTCMGELADCKFSYNDGKDWGDYWDQTRGILPRAIKIVFKFQDEDKEHEFLMNIAVSQ